MSRAGNFIRGCSLILSVDPKVTIAAEHDVVFLTCDLGVMTNDQVAEIMSLGFERDDDYGFKFHT